MTTPNTGGVYVIQSPSGKYRIGLTSSFHRRFLDYQKAARRGKSENEHWIRAIRKYGWASMRIGTLPLPPEEWEETERLFIWLLRANHKDFGYNKTSGGEKSKIYSLETKLLMSQRRKEEASKRIAAGTPHPRKGIPAKQYVLDAMNAGKNKFFKNLTKEQRAKWSRAHLGKTIVLSAQGLLNLKEAHKTDTARANYRAAQRARALKTAKYVWFNGAPTLLSDVARACNVSPALPHAWLKRGKLQLVTTPTDTQLKQTPYSP